MTPAHPELLERFTRWWSQNLHGGWACQWRRRSTLPARILERLGLAVEVEAPLFFGGNMRVVTNEPVSRGILSFGYGEPLITALMLHFLREQDTFVDVGAHFGYEAVLAAHLTGGKGRVLAFEPNPAAHAIAARNLRRWPHARILGYAVGSESGVISMTPPPLLDSAFNEIGRIRRGDRPIAVPMTTLDEQFQDGGPVHLLKCDTEGFELEILKGARNLLAGQAPLIVAECGMPSPGGTVNPRAWEIAAFLAPYHYTLAAFDFNGHLVVRRPDLIQVTDASVLYLPRDHSLLAVLDLPPTAP